MSHSSKLIKPKEEVVGSFGLQPVSQKYRKQPGLLTSIWSWSEVEWVCSLIGLSPQPVESDVSLGWEHQIELNYLTTSWHSKNSLLEVWGTLPHVKKWISNTIYGYTSKRRECRGIKTYMYTRVLNSITQNNQKLEVSQVSIKGWIDKKEKCGL